MSVLVQHQKDRVRIMRAHSLLYCRAEVLADFEIELIREVFQRVVADRVQLGAVTAAEWQVIDDAIDAMRAAPRQDDIEDMAA